MKGHIVPRQVSTTEETHVAFDHRPLNLAAQRNAESEFAEDERGRISKM